MGLGGGLVRRVFHKNRSSRSIGNGNERNTGVDKNRWSAVRFYFCRDELSSVLVEDGTASIRSSEATAMRPLAEDPGDEESCQITEVEKHKEVIANIEENSTSKFSPEKAATCIQSAFRGFMARRRYKEIRESDKDDGTGGVDNASGVNEAASTEVLVGDTAENFWLPKENVAIQHRILHKSRSQGYRLKEEWDDSTISSDTSKLRIQNRLEATTRRERALAYAFSQQLRTCSTKKQQSQFDSTTEPSTGWSWLERWMATRAPENSSVEDCWSKHLEPITTDRRLPMILKKRFDVSVEEKESCGSNDVSISLEGVAVPPQTPREGYGSFKNKLKAAARRASRRKTMPEYHRPVGSTKVKKRDSLKDAEEEKRCKPVQPRSTGEIRSKDASQAPSACQS